MMEYNFSPSSPSSSVSSGSSPVRDVSLRLPSNEELKKEGIDRVIQRLRYAESEHKKLLLERTRSMKDVNKKLQVQYKLVFFWYLLRIFGYELKMLFV